MNLTPRNDRFPAAGQDTQKMLASLLPGVTTAANLAIATVSTESLPQITAQLVEDFAYRFASLVVRTDGVNFRLDYWFYSIDGAPWLQLGVDIPDGGRELPSISDQVHAVDWHERYAEDLFGLTFTGHPKLGDFVLHEEWPEGINPMLPNFDASAPLADKVVDPQWRPEKILQTPGAFLMPIGPVYSDYAESAQFFLETVGEDVVRMIPRFHFKYRGIEKHAEGKTPEDVVLVAERFSGSSAVAHATAFCRAVESAMQVQVPLRAEAIRLVAAELERLRHHLALLSDICHSTGMIVPSADIDIMEEEALRLSARWAGHRYLYGIVLPGGVSRDFSPSEMAALQSELNELTYRAERLRRHLEITSSFLDRFEGVGVVPLANAYKLGLVGPIARASGARTDLRIYCPYGFYDSAAKIGLAPEEARETEGDGYARIRVLFSEIFAAADWIQRVVGNLPQGPILVPMSDGAGEAIGYVEAPKGASFHFVQLDGGGLIKRWHITSPSFINWHGFHLAAENFAFQDFPIMMASFGLSVAESDR